MSDKKALIDSDSDSSKEEADDMWYTPPEMRRRSGGASTSRDDALAALNRRRQGGRQRLDSAVPVDYHTSLGHTFERSASTSSPSQTEPSVRPKERPSSQVTPTHPYRPPIPEHRPTPTPPNVGRYRGQGGSPDFDRMRRRINQPNFNTAAAQGYELSSQSRQEMKNIYKWPATKKGRKEKVLTTRAFQYDPGTGRWSNLSGSSDEGSDVSETSERRHLIPSRERDESALFNQRFFKPQKAMGGRPRSQIMPVGSLGFGRLSPGYMRRSHSMDHLPIKGVEESPSQWNPKELAFARRLRSLSDEHLETYRDYRDQVDPSLEENELAANRMLGPYTDTRMGDINKKFLGKLRRRSLHSGTHAQRKASVSKRASLPSTFGENPPWIGPISERGIPPPPPPRWIPPPPSGTEDSESDSSQSSDFGIRPMGHIPDMNFGAVALPDNSKAPGKKQKKKKWKKRVKNVKEHCNIM